MFSGNKELKSIDDDLLVQDDNVQGHNTITATLLRPEFVNPQVLLPAASLMH